MMDTCNFSSSRRTRRTFAITSIRVIPSPPRFASYEFFLRTKIIPPPRSWLRSGEMKRETFLHDPEKHWPLLPREREEESAMLSRNVTRSTSPRFGIFMRRFVYWISLLVYRVKLEIGIREGMGSGRVSSQDY